MLNSSRTVHRTEQCGASGAAHSLTAGACTCRRPDLMMVIAERAAEEGGEPEELGRAFVHNRPQLPHQKPGIETVSGWTAINGPNGCIRLENFCVIGSPAPPPLRPHFHALAENAPSATACLSTQSAVSAFQGR